MSGVPEGNEHVAVEQRGAVVVARLNRPEARNALSPLIFAGVGAAIRAVEDDPDLRALVITGTGDRAFCAGMDLRAFSEGGGTGLTEGDDAKAFVRLLQGKARIPVVGAAQATAVAGGLELLLACDLAVVADTARFGVPEVKRGLFAAGGGVFLGTRIPLAIALELLLTGDQIDAARAYEVGLVNAVVPAEQVLDAAIGYAERIAANGPLAVSASKEIARLSVVDMAAAQARMAELQPVVFGSEDAKEGSTAFVEKRDPVWRGK